MKKNVEDFQYRLLKAMAAKQISASELSELSGVDKGALSNYIHGKYAAKQGNAYKLAKALDVDPGWLLTGDEPISVTAPLRDAYPPPSGSLRSRIISMAENSESLILDAEFAELWSIADLKTKKKVLRLLKLLLEDDDE